jgi:hypothetical protein
MMQQRKGSYPMVFDGGHGSSTARDGSALSPKLWCIARSFQGVIGIQIHRGAAMAPPKARWLLQLLRKSAEP